MGEHAAYWQSLVERGSVVVFGAVTDPAGVWGVGVVEAEDEAAVRTLVADDPVRRRGAGFSYDVLAMPGAIARGASPPPAPGG